MSGTETPARDLMSSHGNNDSQFFFAEAIMSIKVGINGYGRIGRNILRALYEANRQQEIQIVALNDLGDAQTNAYLTRHDTVCLPDAARHRARSVSRRGQGRW
jgi:lactate dehydrogenase-like 2-hydroxyacid dehydrogenase